MKKILLTITLTLISTTLTAMEQTIRHSGMVLTDETCDILCKAAQDKSREMGLDISFAIAVADGGNLTGMHTCDSRITLVLGGFSLIADGKVVGAIGVGGGTKEQDLEIAYSVIQKFKEIAVSQ